MSENSEQKSAASQQSAVNSKEEVEKLKEVNKQQAAEVERLKGELETLKKSEGIQPPPPSGVLALGGGRANDSSQGESLEVPKRDASGRLCGRDARVPSASATLKTQGIKPARSDGMGSLHKAAKRAAQSNSRSDVAEYMRIRRQYV